MKPFAFITLFIAVNLLNLLGVFGHAFSPYNLFSPAVSIAVAVIGWLKALFS